MINQYPSTSTDWHSQTDQVMGGLKRLKGSMSAIDSSPVIYNNIYIIIPI